MTLEQMKRRDDYCFRLTGIETLVPAIRKKHMDMLLAYSEPVRGAAVLQIGYVDIEVNVFSVAQISDRKEDRNNLLPVIDYFVCVGHSNGEWEPDGYLNREVKVDWNSPDWKTQLERDMFSALDDYVLWNGYSYTHGND